MNLQIKLIEFTIINNLLLLLNNEFNINLLLYLISTQNVRSNNSLISIFDKTDGADYFIKEKLYGQFNSFLKILSEKLIKNKNNYSEITKIYLIENLIWKYKKRNFPIFIDIIKVFEEIKIEKYNCDNNCFYFSNNNIYNIIYFNKEKQLEYKFEIFKIFVYQVLNLIKKELTFIKENREIRNFDNNILKNSQGDIKKLLEKIMSYFIDISPECIHYEDLILFFYKILIKSLPLLNYVIKLVPNVIYKIFKILAYKKKYNNKHNSSDKIKINNIKLIMIKLLCKIIDNLKKDNLKDLLEVIQSFENDNSIFKNPLIYLYQKISDKLKNNINEMDLIIRKYYINLLLICINKLRQFERDKSILVKIISSSKDILSLLLLNDDLLFLSENEFIEKSNNIKTFKDISIFNTVKNKPIKYGKIICFLEFTFNLNNYFDRYYNDYEINSINKFDKSFFLSNSIYEGDIFDNVLVIMNEVEQNEYYNISDIIVKNISELEVIQTENKYSKKFIENNATLIFNIIKDDIFKNKLNEKGIYLMIKSLSKLIRYINKEDLILIFENFYKYYISNKSKENNYPFMSLEFIETVMNNNFNLSNLKKIYKENDESNSYFISFFDFLIENNTLEISRNLEFINKKDKFNLINPFNYKEINGWNSNIKDIYIKSYQLFNLSFFYDKIENYKIFTDNSILFFKPILIAKDLEDLSNIIKENSNKFKVILVNEIGKSINKKDLINFIKVNLIPIYILEKKNFEKLINFFIKGININYIFLYINKNNLIDNSIFTIFKLNIIDYNEQNNNLLENIIKKLPSNQLKQIVNNPSYKTKLCILYQNGFCQFKDECCFAHGEDEKEKIEKIRKYLINGGEEEKYKINRNKLNKELKDETSNLFNILNIKLSKRLIFDIIYQDCIKQSDIEYIFKDIKNIFDIYEVICFEYYFNLISNISNELLEENLLNYFKKLSYEQGKRIDNNKWILFCFSQIEKINYNKTNFILEDFKISNLFNEKNLLDKYYLNPCLFYDKLIVLIKIIEKTNNNEYFIKYYFNIINKILDKIINNIMQINSNQDNLLDNFENLLLRIIINILYDYYNNMTKNNNNNSIQIKFERFKIPRNLDNTIQKLIKANLEDYLFTDKIKNIKISITKKIAFCIEFIFKYFDLCLLLFFRENQYKFFNYMINKDNKIFNYYKNYKFLTMEKKSENDDYKEENAFDYYLSQLLLINDDTIKEIKSKNIFFEMRVNHPNEFKLKNESHFYDINIESLNYDNSIYNKVVIYCSDEHKEKLYFQDIIDINTYKIYDNIYKLRINKNIILIPQKKINTFLYSLDNTSNTIDEFKNNSENFTKYQNIPKYIWDIGYDGNKYLFLSEEDNQVYSFSDKAESKKEEFVVDKRLKEINNPNNKIISFIDEIENISSCIYMKDRNIYILDENKSKYKWLMNKEKNNLNIPIYSPGLKIVNLSFNYNECYAIGINGNLYENKGKGFILLYQVKEHEQFLQCACGEGYLICLMQNDKKKGNIYVKGINNEYQCGINTNNINEEMNENISTLTKIEINDNLDFKYICTYKGFSAALTSCGKLYIWGLMTTKNNKSLLIKSPLLIKNYIDNNIIIDKIYLNNGYLYAIGRILEKQFFIKKLFLLDIKDGLFPILREIKIKDENDNIIPLKIFIGNDKTYFLCIKENGLIEDIKLNIEGNTICLGSLNNYEKNTSIITILSQIFMMLTSPNEQSAFKTYGKLYVDDYSGYLKKAREMTKEYAKI